MSEQKTINTYTDELVTLGNQGFTKTGYKIDKWTSNKDGSGTEYPLNSQSRFDQNTTLYAKWNPEEYGITYNMNGHGTNPNSITKYTIESPTINLANPQEVGWTFNGWMDGNNSYVNTIPQGSTGNKTFNAQWQKKTYNIAYQLNGGSISGQQNTYTITDLPYTPPNPTRYGYNFTGWSPPAINQVQEDKVVTFTATWQAATSTYDINKHITCWYPTLANSNYTTENWVMVGDNNGQPYKCVLSPLTYRATNVLGKSFTLNFKNGIGSNNLNYHLNLYQINKDNGQWELTNTLTSSATGYLSISDSFRYTNTDLVLAHDISDLANWNGYTWTQFDSHACTVTNTSKNSDGTLKHSDGSSMKNVSRYWYLSPKFIPNPNKVSSSGDYWHTFDLFDGKEAITIPNGNISLVDGRNRAMYVTSITY